LGGAEGGISATSLSFFLASPGTVVQSHFDRHHNLLLQLEGTKEITVGSYADPVDDQRVIEGAKKEKQVTVYTSLNLKDSVPITQAFEKKYGVKVELWRSSSEKVLQRAVTEARAGRFSVDAFELNGPEMEALYREGLLDEFYSPQFQNLPPAAFPKHRHYAADRFNFFTIASNTKLVKPDEVPNSYEDLAHPRWVGRIGIEASDTDWFGSIVKYMGEKKGLEFFRKLAHQHRGTFIMSAPIIGHEYFTHEGLLETFKRHGLTVIDSRNVSVYWEGLGGKLAVRAAKLSDIAVRLCPERLVFQRCYVLRGERQGEWLGN